jgi:hypothetical protein
MGFVTQAASKWNTFKGMLTGGTSVERRMAEAVTAGASKWSARGAGLREAASEFAGAGIKPGVLNDFKDAWAGAKGAGAELGVAQKPTLLDRGKAALDTLGEKSFQPGYATRVGVGMTAGAVAGATKSYYDGEGMGLKRTGTVLGGAAIGALAGHGYHASRTPGTIMGNVNNAVKSAWKA